MKFIYYNIILLFEIRISKTIKVQFSISINSLPRKVYTPNSFHFPRRLDRTSPSIPTSYSRNVKTLCLQTVSSPSRTTVSLLEWPIRALGFVPSTPPPPSSSFLNHLACTNLIYTEFPFHAPAFHAWMPISDIADARLNLWHRWTIMALDQPFESVSIKTSITLEFSLPQVSIGCIELLRICGGSRSRISD